MSEAQPGKDTASPALTLTALGLLVGMAVGAMIYFKAGWPVWVMAVLTVALIATATLGLADAASRNFLAGTLRHRTYTQFYRTLVGRRHARLWAALCDPVDPDASLPATFGAALTWRLYDRALLLAVAYPIVLPVLWWLVSGRAATLEPVVFLEATGFRQVWPERVAALGAIVLFSALFAKRTLASAVPQMFSRHVVEWIPILGTSAALAAAGAGLAAGTFAAAGAAPVLGAVVAAIAGGAIGVAARVVAFEILGWPGPPRLAYWRVTIGAVLLWLVAATAVPWESADNWQRSLFLFLGFFPLLNALFDVLSYAVTLALIRRGLRAPQPFWNGLADLVLALVLFLGLGVTLVAVVSILNALAGTDILDVRALLTDVRADPHAYWWLYAMVFSTILPTALHGLLAALGVQGIWPRALRRPVADWVESADRTQLHNLRAAFALGLLWAVPVCFLILLGWGLWHVGADVARTFAEWYLSVLDRTAAFFFVGEGP